VSAPHARRRSSLRRALRRPALLVIAAVAVPRLAAAVPTTVSLPPDVVPLAVEDVLALTPEMRQWVRAQVPRTMSPTEKLDMLVHRLQAIDGAALRYDAWFNASAAGTFAARRYNCLSFSHLLIAMARELGIEAYYLEARYRQRYDREGDLVLLAGHITAGWGNGPRRWIVEFGNEPKLETARVRQLDDRRALALHYSNLGATHLRRGDPGAALAALVTAVEVDPGAAGAWVNLGVALRRRGDFRGAEAAYRRAIEVDAEVVPGFANLYALLRATGRGKEASELVSEIIRLRTKDPWLLLAVGEECLRVGDVPCAERLFKQSRKGAPTESAPAAALATAALARGDTAKALKWLRRAEELNPGEPRLVALRAALGLPPPALRTSSVQPRVVAPPPDSPPPAPN
jgi:Flp pilus assembly protein TadD